MKRIEERRKTAARRARIAAQAAARQARITAKHAAAAEAAANAWHSSYLGPVGDNLDVYVKWMSGRSCADYAVQGCWHIELITENGCSYLSATINEMQGGTIVGNAIANQVNVPPRTPVILELDADTAGVTASAPTVTCY